ncbi:MAG TPA: hypothetical protein VF753_07105 [Terriglobales bacterium]
MPDQSDKSVGKTPPESPPGAKKKYEKPSFRFERVFETMALTCGKVGAVQFQCRFNRKTS